MQSILSKKTDKYTINNRLKSYDNGENYGLLVCVILNCFNGL